MSKTMQPAVSTMSVPLWKEVQKFELEIVPELSTLLADLTIRPTILDKIKEAQQKDSKENNSMTSKLKNTSSDFSLSNDGILKFRNRWYIPSDKELHELILAEAHSL